MDVEIAPTSKAKCWVCGETIDQGEYRFHYKIRKGSTTVRDQRKMHISCLSEAPEAHRDVNFAAVTELLAERGTEDAGLSVELLAAQDYLAGAGGGAPAGAGGGAPAGA